MQNSWEVEFVNEDAEEEFENLPEDIQAKLIRISELIEKYGLNQVGMPYVRHLQGKLWEMRGKGKDGIARSIYVAAAEKRVVILHVFLKKTLKTPQKNINIALLRLKEV